MNVIKPCLCCIQLMQHWSLQDCLLENCCLNWVLILNQPQILAQIPIESVQINVYWLPQKKNVYWRVVLAILVLKGGKSDWLYNSLWDHFLLVKKNGLIGYTRKVKWLFSTSFLVNTNFLFYLPLNFIRLQKEIQKLTIPLMWLLTNICC